MEPLRPQPERSWSEHIRALVIAAGALRIAGSVLATLVVLVGGWWLLKAPPTPVEDRLPLAAAAAPTSSTVGARPEASPGSTSAARVVVHVAGAVRRPGVYRFSDGSRIDDAIERAGGPVGDADLDAVNLAAVLVDGEQVYVPSEGEPGGGGSAATDSGEAPSGPVDLNRATEAELDVLPGVGPSTAAAIVRYREESGPFAAVEDLLDVPGIGPAKLAALADLVTV